MVMISVSQRGTRSGYPAPDPQKSAQSSFGLMAKQSAFRKVNLVLAMKKRVKTHGQIFLILP